MRAKYIFVLLFLAFQCLLTFNVKLVSQVYFDTQGKDFWFAFLPNYHNDKNDSYPKFGDTLLVFVSAEFPTKGKIEYNDKFGLKYTRNFVINDPKQIYTLKLYYEDFELLGVNDQSGIVAQNEDERVSFKTFHVSADTDVTVYALNQAQTTSDAFLVLPTDVLAGDYFVMAYNSDDNISSISNTPSQFVVVAAYDDTHIQIVPRENTFMHNRQKQNITLNQGEAYLVQANMNFGNIHNDLTGSEVHSEKPVAVFGGHQRATLPINTFFGTTSRDCLVEQMLPVKVWGKNAFLVPYVQPAGITTNGNDLYRILAAYDSTEIYINNVKMVTLNRGGYYEGALVNAASVSSNNPIMVAQYKKTANENSNSSKISDPFMMIIPPVEQFMNNYRIINVQAYELDYTSDPPLPYSVYGLQFIILVVHDTATRLVKIDGNAISQNLFKPIPTSYYKYANVPVADGVHAISCPSEVGVYVYGYGRANSYGYTGGMSFKPLDYLPPVFTSRDTCYQLNGFAKDSTMNDSKLRIVREIPDSNINVRLAIENFTPYVPSVSFTADLIDYKQDGRFTIAAEDSIGYKTNQTFEIPGFTVSMNKAPMPDKPLSFSDSTIRFRPICFYIELENYGKFEQTIDELYTNEQNLISISVVPPFKLKPKESIKLQVCFSSPSDTLLIDSLMLRSKCFSKKIYDLRYLVRSDKLLPRVSKVNDSCYSSFDYTITDSTGVDLGIKEYKLLLQENCKVNVIENTIKKLKINISIADVEKDAYYHMTVSDSAGNTIDISDTIPGFTLSLPDWSDTTVRVIDFGEINIGTVLCKKLKIHNYGAFAITLENLYLVVNRLFSVPQSQFPQTINPDETKEFDVCFKPHEVTKTLQTDTIKLIWKNCLSKDIFLQGNGEADLYITSSDCNVPLKMSSGKVPVNFLHAKIVPEPNHGEGSIEISVPEKSNICASIYNSLGLKVMDLFQSKLDAGVYYLTFTSMDMSSGVYLLVIAGEKELYTRYFIIAR